jgi:anti-sigma regulatory factor (Ser/Thr protein kinase)
MEGPAPLRTPGEIDRQTIPVALSSFEKIKQAVFALAGDTQETRMALLACDEALTNIVSYSGATELAFSCEKRNGGLCISFFDNGIPFDPTAVGDEKEFEELDNGGMGLKLIRQNASGMRYERRRNRNELILNFNL